MPESKGADLCESAIVPELSPLTESPRRTGVGVATLLRLAASDPAFPPHALIRLSSRKVLVDIPATIAYLRAQAGKAPRSIRGDAEKIIRGEAEKSVAAGKAQKGAR